MLEVREKQEYRAPKIVVLGVGGGGNNALNRMIEYNDFSVLYVAVNTDRMVLEKSQAGEKLAIGEKLTGGYGAGGDPTIGAASAEESAEKIENVIKGAQMVILTAGMGGGTGTGAIPVIAKICQNQHILTVAVVTKPFSFEGKKKCEIAQAGIARLKESIDTLLVIPNDKLLDMNDQTMDLEAAFITADSVLQNTINAITNIIMNCGTVNLDFNDLRTVLTKKGIAHLGISIQIEGGDVMKAVDEALKSPLLDTSIHGASHVLVNISGKTNLLQLNTAIQKIQELAGEECYIMWGTVQNTEKSEGITVTIIATGLDKETKKQSNRKEQTKGDLSIKKADEIRKSAKRTEQAVVSASVQEKKLEIPTFLQRTNDQNGKSE